MMKVDANKNVSFEEEPHDNCELCGTKDDLRPYGPNRERICIKCADKDPETTKRMMNEAFDRLLAANNLDISEVNIVDPDPPIVLMVEIDPNKSYN